jgi:hypothetical protein
MLLCSCSYMYLVATKKNHVKISTQSKATWTEWGQFFHLKCPYFSWPPSFAAPYVVLLNDPTTSYLFFGVHRHAIGSTKVDIQFGDIGF